MTNYELLSSEIQSQYVAYRRQGAGRNSAIELLTEVYAQELRDTDDAPAVVEGILLALAKKKELSHEIALQMQGYLSQCLPNRVKKSEALLSALELYGSEAVYRHRIPYDPQWQIGDLFSHTLCSPRSREIGIWGWSILFYKVGAYQDDKGVQMQLVYLSVCPSGQEPTSEAQLQSLGFLRMMCHGKIWDYLAQIEAKSKRYIDSFKLTKLGNFQNIPHPADRTDENPLVSLPLFGVMKKENSYPDFEDQVCNIIARCKKAGVPCLSSGI